jgi:hypothetical protein
MEVKDIHRGSRTFQGQKVKITLGTQGFPGQELRNNIGDIRLSWTRS